MFFFVKIGNWVDKKGFVLEGINDIFMEDGVDFFSLIVISIFVNIVLCRLVCCICICCINIC